MVDTLVVPKHANHLVGNTLTEISRSSIAQGGIIKTVRGEVGVHTDFTQESKPLTGTGNLVLVADKGGFRFKPGRWLAQTFAPGDVTVATDLVTLAAHGMLESQGPFQFRPGAASALDQLPGGLTPFYATNVLTLTANATDLQTVTIDGKVYTFDDTTLDNIDGHVLIGAAATDSIDNLVAAITLGAGSGSTYAAATTLHPTVTADVGVGDTMDARAKTFGTAGNALATTETITGDWAAATLLGGLAAINYFIIPGADANSFKVATTRLEAVNGVAVDLTSQGVGTHTITGVHNFSAVPAASVLDGSGAVVLPEGLDVVVQDEEFVTVQGDAVDSVLTFFWTP